MTEIKSDTVVSAPCTHPTIIFNPKMGAICQDCKAELDIKDFCQHKRCRPIPDQYLRAICLDCGTIVTVGMPKNKVKA